MEKADQIKQCNQIIELWREGYTDREIRERLKIEPQDFTHRLQLIKHDNILATESMMLFEKEVIKLSQLYQELLDFISICEPKYKVNAIKAAAELCERKVSVAQKLGAIDPQRFVLEVHDEQRKNYKNMTTEELINDHFAQLKKFDQH